MYFFGVEINSENNGRSSSDSFTQRRDLFSQSTNVRDRRQCGRLLRRILESSHQQPEKSQEFSQQNPANKIVNRHKIRYTATRIKYSPT